MVGIKQNPFAIKEDDRIQLQWSTLCQCYKCGRIVVTDAIIKREEEGIIVPEGTIKEGEVDGK